MAANKKHIKSGDLTQQDLDYAQMLIDWSHSLDNQYVSLEVYEALWVRERERQREVRH